MKKLSIFCAIALVLVTSSCSKTHEPQSGELVKVTFNVSSLDVDVEPMTKSSVNASDGLSKINYAITGNTGTKSGTQTITANPDEFGTIELWLSPGTYTAYIAGYSTAADNNAIINRVDDGFVVYTDNADTFIYASTITIDAENNNYDVTLARYTGKLVIDITDETIPDDVKGLKYEFGKYNTYYLAKGLTPKGGNISESVMKSNGQFPEFGYYMFQSPEMTLTISALGENNAILGATSVSIQIYKNKRTIVRGNILDVITQKGLTITYNDEWGTDVIVPLQ